MMQYFVCKGIQIRALLGIALTCGMAWAQGSDGPTVSQAAAKNAFDGPTIMRAANAAMNIQKDVELQRVLQYYWNEATPVAGMGLVRSPAYFAFADSSVFGGSLERVFVDAAWGSGEPRTGAFWNLGVMYSLIHLQKVSKYTSSARMDADGIPPMEYMDGELFLNGGILGFSAQVGMVQRTYTGIYSNGEFFTSTPGVVLRDDTPAYVVPPPIIEADKHVINDYTASLAYGDWGSVGYFWGKGSNGEDLSSFQATYHSEPLYRAKALANNWVMQQLPWIGAFQTTVSLVSSSMDPYYNLRDAFSTGRIVILEQEFSRLLKIPGLSYGLTMEAQPAMALRQGFLDYAWTSKEGGLMDDGSLVAGLDLGWRQSNSGNPFSGSVAFGIVHKYISYGIFASVNASHSPEFIDLPNSTIFGFEAGYGLNLVKNPVFRNAQKTIAYNRFLKEERE
jgi:hypothetical protein